MKKIFLALILSSTAAYADVIVPSPIGAQGLCSKYSWACDSIPGSYDLDLAVSINKRINSSVNEIYDQDQYGKEDYWALPTSRGGDCEDFSLLKMKTLIEAGFDSSRLVIATVLTKKMEAHAVLILRTDSGNYVLDNLTDSVVKMEDSGYRFLRMQNYKNKNTWVIYRR